MEVVTRSYRWLGLSRRWCCVISCQNRTIPISGSSYIFKGTFNNEETFVLPFPYLFPKHLYHMRIQNTFPKLWMQNTQHEYPGGPPLWVLWGSPWRYVLMQTNPDILQEGFTLELSSFTSAWPLILWPNHICVEGKNPSQLTTQQMLNKTMVMRGHFCAAQEDEVS